MRGIFQNQLVRLGVMAIGLTLMIAAPVTAEQTPMERAELHLRMVYAAMAEYVELTGDTPGDLQELVTLGLLRAEALTDPRLTQCQAIPVEHRAAIALSEDLRAAAAYTLEVVDGQQKIITTKRLVHAVPISAVAVYGFAGSVRPVDSVTARDVRQPAARLGIVVAPADGAGSIAEAPVVTGIIPGYGASRESAEVPSDLRVGDVVLSVGGAPVRTMEVFDQVMAETDWMGVDLEKDLELRVLRGGAVVRVRPLVPIAAIGADIEPDPVAVFARASVWLHPAGAGRLPVTVDRRAAGPAEITGVYGDAGELRVGDAVMTVEQTPVRSGLHMGQLISKYHAGTKIRLGVQRGGRPRVVTVRLSPRPKNMLTDGRFAIYAGQLDVPRAMALATPLHVGMIIPLLERGVSPASAMKWIDTATTDANSMPALIRQTADAHRDRLKKTYPAEALRYGAATPIYWSDGRGTVAIDTPRPRTIAPTTTTRTDTARPTKPEVTRPRPVAPATRSLRFTNREAGVSLVASDAFKTHKNFADDVVLHAADRHPTDELRHRVLFIRRVPLEGRALTTHRDARAAKWKTQLKNFRTIDASSVRVGRNVVPWLIYQYEYKNTAVRALVYFHGGTDGQIYEVSAVERADDFTGNLLEYRKVLASFQQE